jgi:splicing factor 3A subunit 3
LEENKGKYVDMHNVYLDYINLCKSIEEKEGLKVHDYLWFLQNMDKFDDFALNKKMKHNFKYLNYLKVLSSYLEGFIKRSRPLFQLT